MESLVTKKFNKVDFAAFKTALFGESWQRRQEYFEQIHCHFLWIILRAMGELNEPLSLNSVSSRLDNNEKLFDDYCTHLITTVSSDPSTDFFTVAQIHDSLGNASAEQVHLNKRTRAFILFFEQNQCSNKVFLVLAHFLKLEPRYCQLLCLDAQKQAKALFSNQSLSIEIS